MFLMRVARRTLIDLTEGRPPYKPGYVPKALRSLDRDAIVRLRTGGFLFAAGSAGSPSLALAVRDAALVAGRGVLDQDDTARGLLVDPLIEIEVVGKAQLLPVKGDWTQPGAVDDFVEPGVHGLLLVGRNIKHRFCPSEQITSGTVLPDALKRLAQKTHGSAQQLSDTQLFRFRTLHWYQPSTGAAIVTLQRGMTVVPAKAVSPDGLNRTIERLAEYLIYRQLDSGLFTYEYDAPANRYSTDDNLVRQIGATLAICLHARSSGRSASRAACDLAVRVHLRGLRELDGDEDKAFIATADHANKLGVTALFCLALATHPDADRFVETRRRLVNGMRALQRPSGMFVTAFPPAIDAGAQDYFPGEALLAMARQYHDEPTGELLDAFDRAIAFYRDYFRERQSPAFIPWQVQAYAAIAEPTQRGDYVEFVYELTDWLIDRQLTPDNCAWPELYGGLATYKSDRAGIATASYLEGMCDALSMTRRRGDVARAKRYETAVRRAARFVMQLQVRPEEAYFVRSPQDAVWGVRTAPSLDLLRIDHVQHALVSLIKTRDVLFPHEP